MSTKAIRGRTSGPEPVNLALGAWTSLLELIDWLREYLDSDLALDARRLSPG